MPGVPALAASGLLAVFLTTTGFNVLYEHYYFMVLPFMAVCSAVVLADVASLYRQGLTALLAAFAVCAFQAPDLARQVTSRHNRVASDAVSLRVLRKLPGETVLTGSPGIAIFGHKRLSRCYYSADPFGEPGRQVS